MRYTAEEIAKTLGDSSKLADGNWKCRCPSHNDDSASLTVKDSRGKVLVRCHANCEQTKVIDALREMDLWPRAVGKASWEPIVPVPDTAPKLKNVSHFKEGTPVKHWTYRDTQGRLVGYVFRFEKAQEGGEVKKTTLPMSFCRSDDGRVAWTWKSFPKPRPLYNLKELADRPKDPVLVVEGEKSADAAKVLFPTYVCMAWPGGAKAYKYVDVKPLVGRDVTLWTDADKPGRDAMNALGEVLFSEGASAVKVVDVPERLDEVDEGWDVADKPPDWLPPLTDMLARARNFEPGGLDMVEQLNRRYAFVLLGGKGAVLRETRNYEKNKTDVSYLSVDGFTQFFSNVMVPQGKVQVPAGKFWLSSSLRRSYEGVVFAPGGAPPNYYNLWRGFSVSPDENGDWSMFREHLFKNAAKGNEEHYRWILAWFAQIIQQPEIKTGTSLSFRGKQGTGKTIIGKIFGHLIHNHYTLVMDGRQLFGQFNSHMASTLLLHCDESFWGGDPRHAGKLRGLVTSDTHWVEYKQRDMVELANYIRLLITTNPDWVVPAAAEERRFSVFDMGRENEQDKDYFVQMLRQMRDGGYSGLLHALQKFDLESVNLGKIPDTDALRDQKELSMSDVAKFWTYCLTEGEILPEGLMGWPAEIGSTVFYNAMLKQLEKWGSKYRPTSSQFYEELRRLIPEDSMSDVRRNISGKATWCVTLPDLEKARAFMDETFKTTFSWKVEENTQSRATQDDIPF